MTTYGTIASGTARQQKFIESAEPLDLQTRVNDYLGSILGGDPVKAVASMTLAGGGDGHTFVVFIESANAATRETIMEIHKENMEARAVQRDVIKENTNAGKENTVAMTRLTGAVESMSKR